MTNQLFTGLIIVGVLDLFENYLGKEGKNNSRDYGRNNQINSFRRYLDMKRFKKILSLALVFSTVLTLTTGCGNAKTNDNKYLIATDTTFAPFEFEDNGEMVGIDMDILAAIAEDQGFEYELKVLGFNAAVTALESKQVDGVIAGMSITEERAQKYDFSDPYYESGVVMAIKSGNTNIKSYEDLKGQSVAVKNGTEGASFAESVKDKYGFTVKYFDESSQMYDEVLVGNSVACFEDFPVVAYAINQGLGLTIPTEKEAGSSYGFAVYKNATPELLEMFNAGLKNIIENGTYQQILDKYTA